MEAPTLKINEIFYSIQGESLFAGKPTVFVRTATCNLRCTYCYTRHAFWHGEVMPLEAILEKVHEHKTKYVCLTGGEPLGQQGIYPLMQALLDEGYTVSLETNGSFKVDKVPADVVKVIDLKCPESGEADANDWDNCSLVSSRDQFKFVVASKADFDWAQTICAKYSLHEKCSVLYSPVAGKVKPIELAEWILEVEALVTMQLQLHKEIWGPDKRGV